MKKRLLFLLVLMVAVLVLVTSCRDKKPTEPDDEGPPPPEGMVFVEGGTFSPDGGSYNVTLSSFYISNFEVTQSDWTSVMGGIYDANWSDRGQGPNHPAYRISWFDAVEYCNRLSMREGLTPAYSYGDAGTNPANWPAGWNTNRDNHTNVSCNWNANGYRLPTEMEREFAARGGVPAQNAGTFDDTYAGTNVEAELGDYAWYRDNSNSRTHPVGTKLPNELGLYDMSGNVRNWVWDIRANYPTGSYNNPTGPTSSPNRVLRGGSWSNGATGCTVSYRYNFSATDRHSYNGFRVSRVIP